MKMLMRIQSMVLAGVGISILSGLTSPAMAAQSKVVKPAFDNVPLSVSQNSNGAMNPGNYQKMGSKAQKNIAANFGLTPAEYGKYLYDMTYTPDRYAYAPNTSPLWVLAANSVNNKAKFAYYTKRAAKNEFATFTRMNIAILGIHAQMMRMHPHMYPVMTKQMQARKLVSGDSVRLFCQTQSTLCNYILGRALPIIKKTSGVHLDIFLVGKDVTKKTIEAFGKQNNLPMNLVSNGTITLNFGNGPFKAQESVYKKAAGIKQLHLPFVQVTHDGQIVNNVTLGNDHV